MRKEVDVLIVGQGIAGTIASDLLENRGKSFVVIDKGHEKASSRVAAGLINPVTGRRFALSWKFDLFNDFALDYYSDLESRMDIQLVENRPIIRSIHTAGSWNDWLSRSYDSIYEPYVGPQIDSGLLENDFIHAPWHCSIKKGCIVNISRLIQEKRKEFERDGKLMAESLDFSALSFEQNSVIYKDLGAKNILFCEGAGVRFNPLFAWLPFNFLKGQILKLQIPDLELDFIYKNEVFFIRLEKDLYWVGTFDRLQFEDESPTKEGEDYLLEKVNRICKHKFEVLSSEAAIRPTVNHRRPFLGSHPNHPNAFILNGLGSKGTLFAPFLASQILEYMFDGGKLWPEVNIKQYWSQR